MVNTNLLKGAIATAGMTQSKLSKVTGIPMNTLSAKVNGHRPFNSLEIINICDKLGIVDNNLKASIFLSKVAQ